MPRRRSLAYPAWLLGSAVLVLGIAELLVLPPRLPAPSRAAFLMGFVASPGRVLDGVRINALGFTGDEPALEKRAGALRVLTLGGSALFERRMSERLGAALRARTRRPVEVLGAALRVHNSRSSVLKLRHLAPYGFDVVLIYHGINDLDANHVPLREFDADYAQLGPWYVRGPLLDRSVVLRLAYNRWLHRGTPVQAQGSGFASEASFRRNLVTLVTESRAAGAEPVLMTFAWSIPEGYSLDAFRAGRVGYNNPERIASTAVEVWGAPAYVREGLARHNLVVHAVAAEHDVALLDQERLMGHEPFWFGDVCHLSEPGTDRFVAFVADFFAQRGWL